MDLNNFTGYPHTNKLWGYEIQLINCPQYCAKLLYVEPGFACSLHRHTTKDECFFVLEGRLVIEYGTDPSFLHTEAKDPGDCLRLMPGTYHRFWSPYPDKPVLFLEVSSQHNDEDVERLQNSASLDDLYQ